MKICEYLKSKKISRKKAANDLDINYLYFCRICNGKSVPSLKIAIIIYCYTGCCVNLNDWYNHFLEHQRLPNDKCKQWLAVMELQEVLADPKPYSYNPYTTQSCCY